MLNFILEFLELLSELGLRETLAEGLVVYADDEAFNRAAMRAKFSEIN